jgi:hypothetical protein
MMKKLKLWTSVILVFAVIGGGLYGWWALDLRYRGKTVDKDTAEIAKLLESSGWVSPHVPGNKRLYMISFRSCPYCILYEKSEFAALQKAGVDTRVILVARRDLNGVTKSQAAERSTVAELWVNRSWPLYEAWNKVQPPEWTAPNIIPADGDLTRTAVVELSRKTIDDLETLLKPNGVELHYPTLIWWDDKGQMRAYVGWDKPAARKIRKELGA